MADEKDIAEEEESVGNGKKKLMIIVGGVVLLLVIGAAVAFFLLAGEEETATEAESAEAVEPAVEDGEPIYHKIDPTFVVNLPPGGAAKMLQVAIQVMTRSQTVVDSLQANDPMIRHHLLNLMEEQSADSLMTLEGKQALQQAIQDELAEQLKALKTDGEIKGVFFTQFVMQ